MIMFDKKIVEGDISYVQVTKSKFLELDEAVQNQVQILKRKAGHKNPIYLRVVNEQIISITTSREAAQEIRKARTETRIVLFEKFKRKKTKYIWIEMRQ